MDLNDSADGAPIGSRPTPLPDSGNTGWFVRPNVGGGIEGTTVTADFLNDIGGTLRHVLVAAGLTPTRGDDTQLETAIEALAQALVDAHADDISSEGVAAHLEVTNASEFSNGVNNARALTPASGRRSLGATGYYELPGGLLVQWGSETIPSPGTLAHDVTLPIAYSTAQYFAIASAMLTVLDANQGPVGAEPHPTTPLTTVRLSADDGPREAFWLTLGR